MRTSSYWVKESRECDWCGRKEERTWDSAGQDIPPSDFVLIGQDSYTPLDLCGACFRLRENAIEGARVARVQMGAVAEWAREAREAK